MLREALAASERTRVALAEERDAVVAEERRIAEDRAVVIAGLRRELETARSEAERLSAELRQRGSGDGVAPPERGSAGAVCRTVKSDTPVWPIGGEPACMQYDWRNAIVWRVPRSCGGGR